MNCPICGEEMVIVSELYDTQEDGYHIQQEDAKFICEKCDREVDEEEVIFEPDTYEDY